MPDCHDPDDFAFRSVEKSIRTHDHLAVREIGELWEASPGIGKTIEAAEDRFRSVTKTLCGRWIVSVDV